MNSKKTLIGIFIGALVVTSLILINHVLILSRIYYRISYNDDVNNIEKIVEKSEFFDFQKNCKCRDYFGIVHNVTNYDYFYHIDNDFIVNLKSKISNDHEGFHLYPFYEHHFVYSFEATDESLLFFTYNNNSIIKLEDQAHTEIFSAHERNYENSSTFWEGSWYLNFTLIPFSSDLNSIIQLNNSILTKMDVHYEYDYALGEANSLIIEQFLCFNSNYQIIFVYIPNTAWIVA